MTLVYDHVFDYETLEKERACHKRLQGLMRATVYSIRLHKLDELEGPSGHLEAELLQQDESFSNNEQLDRISARDATA